MISEEAQFGGTAGVRSPKALWEATVDDLVVSGYANARELGAAAAFRVAETLARSIRSGGEANLVLATGQSQMHFVSALVSAPVDWSKVNLFHQDEYVGIPADETASFRSWIQRNVLSVVTPKRWFPMEGDGPSPEAEALSYDKRLREFRPDVCVIGVGENSHIAFNDPPANLETTALAHVVLLDDMCRRQQVNEGQFSTVEDVPRRAISLTIRGILWAREVIAVVPEGRKALAVRCSLQAPISALCPASQLRTAPHARLLLDQDSSRLLDLSSADMSRVESDGRQSDSL